MSFVIVSRDGLTLPEPEETENVIIPGGGRVEFLARFDTPGEYTMTRLAFKYVPNEEACLEAFGAPIYPCFSYDIDKEVATIVVTAPADDPAGLPTDPIIDTLELPPWSEDLQQLAFEQEVVGEKTIAMTQAVGFPLFQIPYEGPFIPPGTAFGMNNRLANPQYLAGEVVAGTCETWTVTSTPPGAQHAFHVHTGRFLVTHLDGVEVERPYLRDTQAVNFNMTVKICFDAVEPDDILLVHCHMPSHQDIGMSMRFNVVAPTDVNPSDNQEPTSAPMEKSPTVDQKPTSATPADGLSLVGFLVVGLSVAMLVSVS